MPRLFTGLELPDEIRDELVDLERPLSGATWIDADDLHVTIRHFGDISVQSANDLADLLETTTSDAFSLQIKGVATLGTQPRVLCATIEPTPELSSLAKTHDRLARLLALPPSKHPFKAHITLARLDYADPVKLARLLSDESTFACEPFFVHRYALFSSKPHSGGGPYQVEALYPLRGGLGAGEDEDGNPW